MQIYHIVKPEVWENYKKENEYEAESLMTEGFIHCSFADQLEGVLQRYYTNEKKVLILTIEPENLTSKLVNEPSTNNEIYPHIYGKINKSAIVSIEERKIETTDQHR